MSKIAILGGVTCLFTLAALGLVAYHTTAHCYTKTGDVKDTECVDGFEKACPGSFLISTSGTTAGVEVDVKFSCPWKKETAILGLIGLCLTQICLAVLFFVVKGKNLKAVMLGLAGLIVPILLATFGLMIRDLKKGYDYKDEAGITEGWKPGTFIANIILVFFGACMVGTAAFMAHRHTAKN